MKHARDYKPTCTDSCSYLQAQAGEQISLSTIRVKIGHIPGLRKSRTPIEVYVDLHDSDTVGSLMSRLIVSRASDIYSELIDPETRQLRNDVVVMINGENILARDGFDTRLKVNDEILVLAVTAGG